MPGTLAGNHGFSKKHGDAKEDQKMKNKMESSGIGIVAVSDVNGPYSVLTLNESGVMAHDLAGDGTLLFVGQVLPASCFRVFHQETKEDLGVFPAPSRGHIVPFKFRLGDYQKVGKDGSKGTVYMMDGVYPKIAGFHDALILKYEYEYTRGKGLKADLVKEYRIPSNTVHFKEVLEGARPNGAMFITGFDFIDGERAVLADCFAGVMWLFDLKTETLTLAFTHRDFGCQPWREDLTITLADGTVQDGLAGWTHRNRKELVPFKYNVPAFEGLDRKIFFGLHGVTVYESGTSLKVVFVSPATPGIYAIDASELARTDIPHDQKKFETIVPDINCVSSYVAEVQADKYNPGSPWVYFQRAMSNSNEVPDKGYEKWKEKYWPLYRVNMETKRIEFVADDWKLWDFNTNLNVMPGKAGYIILTSTPVQQERIPHASGLLEDMTDFSGLPEDFVFPLIEVKS